VREGIPSFATESFFWSEVEQGEMRTVLEVARERGWRESLLEAYHPENLEAHTTAADPRRADWSFLLPLTRDSVALDIGCGWGAVSFALAKTCRAVVAMDATWERISFVEIRREQEGVDNLYPVHGGDTLRFPFPDESFDVAAMVGVLEWVGVSHPALPPQEAQAAILRNAHALLKPGGHLYIGIENRYGYQYWMGSPDHNGVRYVSLLPRWLANTVSLRRTGRPYATYQYSRSGYRRLLCQAGFSDVQFFAPVPQYRSPRFYLPLDTHSAVKHFLAGEFASTALRESSWMREHSRAAALSSALVHVARRLPLTHWLNWFAPGFSIVARK
jgi:SAM-dependent methyltransferase